MQSGPRLLTNRTSEVGTQLPSLLHTPLSQSVVAMQRRQLLRSQIGVWVRRLPPVQATQARRNECTSKRPARLAQRCLVLHGVPPVSLKADFEAGGAMWGNQPVRAFRRGSCPAVLHLVAGLAVHVIESRAALTKQ